MDTQNTQDSYQIPRHNIASKNYSIRPIDLDFYILID